MVRGKRGGGIRVLIKSNDVLGFAFNYNVYTNMGETIEAILARRPNVIYCVYRSDEL